MTALRQEILGYINEISDNQLEALKPILTLLVNHTVIIENDLTDDEKLIITNGRDEYKKGGFVTLN